MEKLNAVLKLINKENIKFPIRETKSFMETPITCLDLDNRSYNALSHHGIKTIGDVLSNCSRLTSFKNYGTKSFNRTMYALCAYQYNLMTPEKQSIYLERIIELNL